MSWYYSTGMQSRRRKTGLIRSRMLFALERKSGCAAGISPGWDPLKSLGEQEEPNILLLQEHEVTNPLIQPGVHEKPTGRATWVLYIAGTRLLYLRYEARKISPQGKSASGKYHRRAVARDRGDTGGRMKPLYFSDLRRRFLVGEAENRIQYLCRRSSVPVPGRQDRSASLPLRSDRREPGRCNGWQWRG